MSVTIEMFMFSDLTMFLSFLVCHFSSFLLDGRDQVSTAMCKHNII